MIFVNQKHLGKIRLVNIILTDGEYHIIAWADKSYIIAKAKDRKEAEQFCRDYNLLVWC